MIVPMKKTTLLCMASERDIALEKLRDLGVMHLQTVIRLERQEQGEIKQQLTDIEKISAYLGNIKITEAQKLPVSQGNGQELYRETVRLLDEQQRITKDLSELNHKLEILRPWGEFSESLLKQLAGRGVFVYPCAAAFKEIPVLRKDKGLVCKIISQEKHFCRFVVVSDRALDAGVIPLVPLPENTDLKTLEEAIYNNAKRDREITERIKAIAASAAAIEKYKEELGQQLEFVANRDGMTEHGRLAYITGYIPARDEEKLKKAAILYGWGLQFSDPDPGDDAPTLIALPKPFRIIRPLFEFLGISTGYNEVDVSICFLFFFSIFFGIIFSDAGYGVLFLSVGLIAKAKLKEEKFRLQLNLFIVLSVVTVVWGALCGCWFGIEWGGLEWLAEPAHKNAHIQLLCFILAGLHLSTGHFLQALKKPVSKKALGQLGWILVLWGNFILAVRLLIYPGDFPLIMFILYGAGLFLILTCFINWKEAGEVFSFPFEAMGSFVDMLSYIRLFAVSVAGYYIAVSFNDMGVNLCKTSPLLIIVAVLTLLGGHALNIILALLGVLVHAVRLNTLEFSNHAHLRWAGVPYKPFKKKE